MSSDTAETMRRKRLERFGRTIEALIACRDDLTKAEIDRADELLAELIALGERTRWRKYNE